MNDSFVLDVANSLEELERDFNDWQSLQYDFRRKSDDACIRKYGLTNTQFYNMQRANFIYYSGYKLQHEIANIKVLDDEGNHLAPTLSNLPPGCTTTGEINIRADKILASRRVEEMDDEWIVIPDWLDEDTPDYDLDDLIKHYDRFLSVTQDHKDISNAYSISIWGKSVPEMYTLMRSKLEKNHSTSMEDPIAVEEAVTIPAFTPDLNDQSLNNFRNTIVTESQDDLQLMIRKLDCLCPHKSSLYESHVLESYGDKIKIGKKTYRADMPGVVPFLQYDEYVNNPNSLDMTKIVGGMFPYILSYNEKPIERFHELQDAFRDKDTQKLLEMGWNPVIKPTMETLEIARERQINYIDKQYPIDIFDISEYSTNYTHEALFEAEMEQEKNFPSTKQLKPIFFVLACKDDKNFFSKISNKLFYDKEYSHVGVSFDSSLGTIYTFDQVTKGGLNKLRVESIDDYKLYDGTVRIISFFVRKEIYTKLKDSMRIYFSQQDNSPYSFDNAFSLVADMPKLKGKSLSLICAAFLDSMFKMANVHDKLAGMKSSKARIHFYILFTGNPKGYKFKDIDKKVKTLQKNLDFQQLSFFEPDLVLDNIQYKMLEGFNIKTSDSRINSVLEQIREMLTPTDAYLEEATVVPEVEMQRLADAHNILSTLGSTDIELMKRELVNLTFGISRLTEYRTPIDKIGPMIDKIDLAIKSAKIDLLTYLKVVLQAEKGNFSLEEYIAGTPYADELKEIDRSLFKYDSANLKN